MPEVKSPAHSEPKSPPAGVYPRARRGSRAPAHHLTWGVAFSVNLGSHRNLATIAVPGTSKFLLSTSLGSLEKGKYFSYLVRKDETQSKHLPGTENLPGSIGNFLGI